MELDMELRLVSCWIGKRQAAIAQRQLFSFLQGFSLPSVLRLSPKSIDRDLVMVGCCGKNTKQLTGVNLCRKIKYIIL